jgi:hypothetical protein
MSIIVTNTSIECLHCTFDPVYFITNYCYTLDPHGKDKVVLVPKWDYIVYLIENIHKNQNNLIEKSRQMMVSWISQAYNVWGLLFGEGYTALNLSRKEDLVDNNQPDSLFGKMRFIWDKLPKRMVERQLGRYKPAKTAIRFLRAENRKRNNTITGESTNPDAGRGGTYLKIFADEFGFVDKDEIVYSAFNDACPNGKNLITTPPLKGRLCKFYKLKSSAAFNHVRIHWRQHPHRDDAWFHKVTQGRTPDEIARELEIDWDIAVKGRIFPNWRKDFGESKFSYNSELPLYIDFDFGIGDSPVSVGLSQDLPTGETIYLVDDEYFGFAVEQVVPEIKKLLERVGYRGKIKDLKCYGDPTGKAKGATGKSWISEFARFGFDINYTTNSKKRDLEYGHLILNRMIYHKQLFCTPDCRKMLFTMENYRRNDNGMVIDDESKHRADGIRYKAINTRKDIEDYDKRLLNQIG